MKEWVGLTDSLNLRYVDASIDLGYLYPVLIFLVLAGATNGVNLTDGLDGLAAGCCAIVFLTFTAMTFITQGEADLALFCACVVGACVGFLWFNSFPASVFMGDTGSLALGGAIAALAVLTKTELLLVLIGGIFVIEALSVAIQVVSFQRFRRRVFLMAPIHHHFELMGWSETKIILRFWIVAAICAAIGFTLYQQSISEPAPVSAGRPPLPEGPYLVVGLARSGLAAARMLESHGRVIACDAGRPECPRAGRAPRHRRSGAAGRGACVVKSPGVPREAPVVAAALERGIPVHGELELAWRLLPNRFVAVTGTNGKTTTVELLGEVFRAEGTPVAVAGNVGTPLSSQVGSLDPGAVVVCETSSFQLEDASAFAPDTALLLNLEEDHLDRHGTFERYREAKMRVFARQEPGTWPWPRSA